MLIEVRCTAEEYYLLKKELEGEKIPFQTITTFDCDYDLLPNGVDYRKYEQRMFKIIFPYDYIHDGKLI